MRLAALVESTTHVCCRYRLAAFRPAFIAHGHTLDLYPLPQSPLGRFFIGRNLAEYDAVILQRKLLPRWVLERLRRRIKRLIFDFDDALWLRDSYSAKGFHDPHRVARFQATIAAADAVVAGNDYLAAQARQYVAADRVHVVPTCVDVSKYSPRTEVPQKHLDTEVSSKSRLTSEKPPLTLVWIGSSSTLQGLERFAPTLSAIGRALPGTRLKLICDRFTEFPPLIVQRSLWHEATEAQEIATADVGIAWVPDDPWSHGKCGLKILQYQAAGLPVVANPVGVQAQMVHAGTGFQAVTTEQWVKAIRTLAACPPLRAELGRAGRRQVEAQYSTAAGARLWLDLLERWSHRCRRAS
ncbi:MAG: glycosyltransferase family 4 protein [Gemmataceae bacterium]|nr:glycosyltransferase family 4 protein [Gemmata sp.]MDW8196711.1 glycosyltransferase family 4 protein [Gemmataceae bacterium]